MCRWLIGISPRFTIPILSIDTCSVFNWTPSFTCDVVVLPQDCIMVLLFNQYNIFYFNTVFNMLITHKSLVFSLFSRMLKQVPPPMHLLYPQDYRAAIHAQWHVLPNQDGLDVSQRQRQKWSKLVHSIKVVTMSSLSFTMFWLSDIWATSLLSYFAGILSILGIFYALWFMNYIHHCDLRDWNYHINWNLSVKHRLWTGK